MLVLARECREVWSDPSGMLILVFYTEFNFHLADVDSISLRELALDTVVECFAALGCESRPHLFGGQANRPARARFQIGDIVTYVFPRDLI